MLIFVLFGDFVERTKQIGYAAMPTAGAESKAVRGEPAALIQESTRYTMLNSGALLRRRRAGLPRPQWDGAAALEVLGAEDMLGRARLWRVSDRS